MPDALNSSDPSKSAFLEFGHGLAGSQQHLSGFAHNIYPVHGLHSGGHLQHDAPYPSTASHYRRPLGYAYPGPVSAPAPGAYMPYQPNNHSSTLAHARVEETSEYLHKTSECEVLTCFHCFLKDTACSLHVCERIFFPYIRYKIRSKLYTGMFRYLINICHGLCLKHIYCIYNSS